MSPTTTRAVPRARGPRTALLVGSLGFFLITLAIGFADPLVLTSLGLAIVSLGAFFVVQARAAHPMIPLGLFRSACASRLVV